MLIPLPDPERYLGLSDQQIAAQLHDIHGRVLLRGRLETLLARREIGGLLVAYATHHPRDRNRFEAFAKQTVDLSYDEGRRHMQLWVYWPRCVEVLQRLDDEAMKTGKRLSVPGLRRLLALAGVIGRRPLTIAHDTEDTIELIYLPLADLPDDIAALKAIIQRYQQVNRVLRAEAVIGRNDLRRANEIIQTLRARIRQMPKLPDS